MGFFNRNVNYIKSKETDFFKQIGMTKIGYEGFLYSFSGGQVWYSASFPNTPEEQHTIGVESLFGNLRLTYQRWLNPRVMNDKR